MKLHNKNSNGKSIEIKQTDHQLDLKEAITYLPRNFDQGTLFRALKKVYGDEGIDIANEWLIKSKNFIPSDFPSRWDEATLTRYQQENFDSWISQNIYDIAEKTGWVPKALSKGKQSKRPPRKRKQKLLEQHIEADNKLEQHHVVAKENGKSEQEKSFIPPCIVNKFGGCYQHPYMRKHEIPDNEQDYREALTKLVDCEVHILEACEYVEEKNGREPHDIQVRYRIKLDNGSDKSMVAQVTHEELTTKTRFSSFLVSKGFVKFQGNTKDFDKFHHFLLKEQDYPTVRNPAHWGEYRPGVFLFENGIFCTHAKQFYQADDQGRIKYKGNYIVCPSGSLQVKPPLLAPLQATTTHFLTEKFALWESFNGPLNVRTIIGYAVSCLFSREIIEKLRGFPILFKYGIRGTGKSTSMDWLMALFGYRDGNQQSVSKQNTSKSVLRRMSLPRSFPFFLDDYRNHETNSNVPDLTSAFLNWYQRIGTGMAAKTTDQTTIDTHMRACVVMTGNDKPLDPAAISRMLVLNFNNHLKQKKLEEVQEFDKHTDRLSEFYSLLLEHYDTLHKAFFDLLDVHRKYLSDQKFEGRIVNNWAMILAGVESLGVVLPELGWHEEMPQLQKEVCRAIRNEQALEGSQNQLLEFFHTLNYFASEKKNPVASLQDEWYALDRRHFHIDEFDSKVNNQTKADYCGPALAFHLPGIWNVLKDAGADITRQNAKSTIESRIQNSELFLARSVNVYMYKNHKGLEKKNKRCYLLNMQKLEENGMLDDLIEKAKEYQRQQ